MTPLEKVLTYQNQDAVWRFCENFEVTQKEANSIFIELKKLLWLCAVIKLEREQLIENLPERLVIDETILIIDEMWHNFICFTKEYNDFCMDYFGFFIHHYPATKSTNEKTKKQLKINPNIQIEKRRIQYDYIYEKLGEKTLIKWYDTFPTKYTKEYIKTIRKK